MGRIFILAGISTVVYVYSAHNMSVILAVVGFFLLTVGVTLYFFTDLKWK
jgi:uncharacterized membrane protein